MKQNILVHYFLSALLYEIKVRNIVILIFVATMIPYIIFININILNLHFVQFYLLTLHILRFKLYSVCIKIKITIINVCLNEIYTFDVVYVSFVHVLNIFF